MSIDLKLDNYKEMCNHIIVSMIMSFLHQVREIILKSSRIMGTVLKLSLDERGNSKVLSLFF